MRDRIVFITQNGDKYHSPRVVQDKELEVTVEIPSSMGDTEIRSGMIYHIDEYHHPRTRFFMEL